MLVFNNAYHFLVLARIDILLVCSAISTGGPRFSGAPSPYGLGLLAAIAALKLLYILGDWLFSEPKPETGVIYLSKLLLPNA
jgi:hypothetical protein